MTLLLYTEGIYAHTWFKERELAEQSVVPTEAQRSVKSWNGAGATQ